MEFQYKILGVFHENTLRLKSFEILGIATYGMGKILIEGLLCQNNLTYTKNEKCANKM